MKSLRMCSLLVVILLGGSAAIAQPAPQMLSYRVPEQTWKAEIKSFGKSTPFRLADYKGKVTLLAVWAYWCRPSVNGLNDLARIKEEFAGQNLEVIGISLHYNFDDDNNQEAIEFVRRSNFKFKMGWINAGIRDLLMADDAAVPSFMLLTSDGVLVERILGFNPAKTPTLLREAIRPLLKKEE